MPLEFIQIHHFNGRQFTSEQFNLAFARGAARLFHPTVLLLKDENFEKKPLNSEEPFLLIVSPNGIITLSSINFSSNTLTTKILSKLRNITTNTQIEGFILDLRDSNDLENYHQAARLSSLFLPPQREVLLLNGGQNGTLESYQTSETEPHFLNTPICLLVDSSTAGVAEALARILSTHGRALVVGQPTKAMLYTYHKTQLPCGSTLAVADAIAIVPESHEQPHKPVTPDIIASPQKSVTVAEDFLKALIATTATTLASLSN